MKYRKLARVAAGALALAIVTSGAPSPAMAQSGDVYFQLPAQPLAHTLLDISRQANVDVMAPEVITQGRNAPAISGRMSARQALERALAGSGLRLRARSGTSFIVDGARPGNAPAPAEGAESLSLNGTGRAEVASAEDGSDAIVVTGTRLRGTSPTSPVIMVDRKDFERGGYTSAQEVLERTSQNFSGVSASTGGDNLNLGFSSQADIRGLGSEATLTLVNGRRVSGAGGDDGRAFDLSMIPIAAISRIDILTDGASALYGSDAIGGVVNIILRRDFEGVELNGRYGRTRFGDSDYLASSVAGMEWDGGQALVVGQYSRSDALKYADIGLGTTDLRFRGGGDYRTPLFGSPGTVMPAGYSLGLPFATLTGPGGSPVFSVTLPDGDGRDLGLDDLVLNGTTTSDRFNHDLTPAQKNVSIYTTLEQDLGGVTLFVDTLFASRNATSVTSNLLQPLYVPQTNAFSPFDEDVFVFAELSDFGPLTMRNERQGWFVNAGARGDLGAGDWTWSLVGTASQDDSVTNLEFVDQVALAGRVASSDPTVAFNPFGNGTGQSSGVVDALRSAIVYRGETSLHGVSAQGQGTLFQLPGGRVRLAAGAEYREEGLSGGADAGSLGDRDYYADAERSSAAVFGEFYIPLFGAANARSGLRELAISAAARGERFSDFGTTFNPKLGLLWRPTSDLLFKANWGTSFRAPSLRELFFANATSENASVFDPRRPGGPGTAIVDILQGGNMDLQEEQAETYTLTGELRPGWLPNARLALTYYHTVYENRIRGTFDGLDVGTLLANEDLLPPGVIVRDASGALEQIRATNINSARTIIAGFDLMAAYSWSVGGLGDFDISANATLLDKYDDTIFAGLPAIDLRGTVGNPAKWRANSSLNWTKGPLGATLTINRIGGSYNRLTDPRIVRRDVDGQTTVDAQLRYAARASEDILSGLTLRLGVQNLFDAQPAFVDGPNLQGVDATNALLRPRTVYLSVTKAFGDAQ